MVWLFVVLAFIAGGLVGANVYRAWMVTTHLAGMLYLSAPVELHFTNAKVLNSNPKYVVLSVLSDEYKPMDIQKREESKSYND